MKHPNRPGRYAFADKVKVNLGVFGALMLHRIGREIHCTDIVAIDNSGTLESNMQLLK
jgi:nucleoside-triphosphatase THEP1